MHIGFDNQVPHWKVAAILTPRGAAAKRLRDEAYRAGRLVDATCGKKTRSMVITDANQVILAARSPEILMDRLKAARLKGQSGDQQD